MTLIHGITSRRNRRRTAAIVAALLLCAIGTVIPTQSAQAYSLTGCKFASSTIPYLVSGLPSGYNLTAARDDWTNNTDVAGWATTTVAVRVDFRFNPYGSLGWSGGDGRPPAVTCRAVVTTPTPCRSASTGRTPTAGPRTNGRVSWPMRSATLWGCTTTRLPRPASP